MPDTQIDPIRIQIPNPSIDNNPRTYLTGDLASGVTTLNVLSTDGFEDPSGTSDDYGVIIGNYGEEKCEIVIASAKTATTFTVGATVYSHTSSEPVTFIAWNQIKFYTRDITGGTETDLVTRSIACSSQYTEYIYSGVKTIFTAAYYNSSTTKYGPFLDEITSSVFGLTSVKSVLLSAARKSKVTIDNNEDSEINWDNAIEIVNDGFDEIMDRKQKWPFLYTISTGTNTTASTNYISIPTTCALLLFIKINGNKLDYISPNEYNRLTGDGVVIATGQPSRYTIKDSKYYLYPTPDSTYAIIYEFYAYPTQVTKLSDSIDREFRSALIYYVASQMCYIKGNDKRGDKYYTLFGKALEQKVIQFTGYSQAGDPETIEFLSSSDTDLLE